jgi:exopolyphosphatase / guanosine-5'-triphosphate,3'-diphosphate pyrophosphatase
VVIGVIDIGTNTTRLLVAEVSDGRLRPKLERRHFLSAVSEEEAAALPGLVEREAAIARESGAQALISAGTAGLRGTGAARGLDRVCARVGAGGLRILSPGEEAELAFLGATSCEPSELPESVAVVDVGGGSTEIAVGTPGESPGWWASRPVGSHRLTQRALRSDPPTRDQVAAARNAAARRFVGVEPPDCELALAVGGGSTSLRRISGGEIDRAVIGVLLERLVSTPSEELGAELGIAPQRVRLLPAALAVLEAVCELLPEPLRIARGGVREGLALDRSRQDQARETP